MLFEGCSVLTYASDSLAYWLPDRIKTINWIWKAFHDSVCQVKSVQSALSDLLTTSGTHGTFSRPSAKRGLISIIKLMQFAIARFF